MDLGGLPNIAANHKYFYSYVSVASIRTPRHTRLQQITAKWLSIVSPITA